MPAAKLDFSPDALRRRYREVTEEFDRHNAPLLKLKADRDALGDKITAAEAAKFDAKIRKANEGLYELEMERAALARALGPRGLIDE